MAEERVYTWAPHNAEPNAEFSSGRSGAVVANSYENEQNLQFTQMGPGEALQLPFSFCTLVYLQFSEKGFTLLFSTSTYGQWIGSKKSGRKLGSDCLSKWAQLFLYHCCLQSLTSSCPIRLRNKFTWANTSWSITNESHRVRNYREQYKQYRQENTWALIWAHCSILGSPVHRIFPFLDNSLCSVSTGPFSKGMGQVIRRCEYVRLPILLKWKCNIHHMQRLL